MKRVIAAILGLALCLSLACCGGNNEKEPIVGKWIASENAMIVFNDDGICLIDDVECKWSYDKNTDMYTIHLKFPVTFTIKERNGIRSLDFSGMITYYHADDYDKVEK